MVQFIYGAKGTGKTKKIIESVNETCQNSKGHVVYITNTHEHMYSIRHQVRYVNTLEYRVNTVDRMIGLLAGLIAGNADNEFIYIDGVHRICGCELSKLESFFDYLEFSSKENGVNFVLTISSDYSDMPDFVKKFVK